MATVTIPQAEYNEIVKHAREGKPEEVCGIVRGKGLQAFEVIRGLNIAEGRIENYTVDPQTLLLQFKFEEQNYPDGGTEMMGIYHSHPVSVAYPSATDAWNAHYPESVYFICSLALDHVPVLRAFHMVSYFEDESLSFDLPRLQKSLSFYEIRPQSGVYAYFHDYRTPPSDALVDFARRFETSFYLLYHLDEDNVTDFDTRIVPIVEHTVEVTAHSPV